MAVDLFDVDSSFGVDSRSGVTADEEEGGINRDTPVAPL